MYYPKQRLLDRYPYLLIVIAAFVVRVAQILIARTYNVPELYVRPPFSLGDPHFGFGYEIGSIARSIATGHGYSSPFGTVTGPTSWIAPVYPYMCAAIFKIFGVFSPASAFVIFFINSIFAALTCIPIYRICERTVGRVTGVWAGWAWALLPYFWVWPTTLVWETSLLALLVACLVLMTLELAQSEDAPSRNRWIMFGLLWGVALLTNAVVLTFLPISFGWLAYSRRREGTRSLRPAIWALVTCALVVTPWLVRNRVVFGQLILIRSNFGFEFHLGNYHFSNGFGWAGKHPTLNKAERDEYTRLGEVAYVAVKKKQGIEFVRQYPEEFVALTGKRIRAFWSGELLEYGKQLPLPWLYGLLSFLTLFGVLFAVRNKVNGLGLLFALLLLFPWPFYVAFPQARNRHSIEPEILILAVYALTSAPALLRGFQGGKPEEIDAPSLPAKQIVDEQPERVGV